MGVWTMLTPHEIRLANTRPTKTHFSASEQERNDEMIRQAKVHLAFLRGEVAATYQEEDFLGVAI